MPHRDRPPKALRRVVASPAPALISIALAVFLVHCGSDRAAPAGSDARAGRPGSSGGRSPGGTPSTGATGSGASDTGGSDGASGGRGAGGSGGGPESGGSAMQPVDAGPLPDAAPPKMGQPGCGFAAAAFCDTFDGPAKVRGRAGELDARFWSGARMEGQLSTTRAIGIGMAVIPACRAGVPANVWPNDDTLVCDPSASIASNHLLVAVAAQNYGQNSYRIRQPFDFAGRTGKVVFDATAEPLSPLRAWVSFAVTEDPMAAPGYSILGNDEGSIIPRNAVEVHFVNAPGSTDDRMAMRNVHVFENYVDTVYAPETLPSVSYQHGKLNHFEFSLSESGVDVAVTPYSDDGKSFDAPAFTYHAPAHVPFTRGYVHVTVHNHATIKYTHSQDGFPDVVDASIAHVDNVAFDGPVIESYREYEVPNALVEFNDPGLGDPHNTENRGYDVGYVVGDESQGPKQVLELSGVDPSGATSATLTFSAWFDGSRQSESPPDRYAFRARFNGKSWREHKLSAPEVALLVNGPTTVDPKGGKVGDPHSQGRLALSVDVPLADLVAGKNTLEFVTAAIPNSYPPLVCNVDLILKTK